MSAGADRTVCGDGKPYWQPTSCISLEVTVPRTKAKFGWLVIEPYELKVLHSGDKCAP